MRNGNKREYWRIGAAVALAASLVACGGSGGDGGWDGTGAEPNAFNNDPDASVLVGIENVTYSVTSTTTDDNNNTTTKTTTRQTTPAGAFDVASKETCTSGKDAQGNPTQTCDYSGFQAPVLSVGGQLLPPLPPKTNGYVLARYTLKDFGAAAFNVAKFILMGNSTPGDPLINGIKLSSGFSTTDCAPFDWGTTNIDQDAACFVTQADKDGVKHAWPSTDTVNQFLQQQWLTVNQGYKQGWQANSPTAAYPTAATVSGLAAAIAGPDGSVDGWFDFTRTGESYGLPSVTWSGTLTLTGGQGGGSLTANTGSTGSIPNLVVNFGINPNGPKMTYQSADGTLEGGTGTDTSPGGLGSWGTLAIAFPKYNFLLRDVSYTVPGESVPTNYVLNLVIGYGGYAYLELTQWLPLPWSKYPPLFLEMYGQLNKDNTVTLHWYKDDRSNITRTSKATTLTFDPTTLTLTGDMIGYDGAPWTSITIHGWRT